MFGRKLQALGFYSDVFDCEDEKQFRNLVIWLEESKIRHYKVDERTELRDVESDNWANAFTKYLQELKCVIKSNERMEILEWLLGQACRFQYQDNVETYQEESRSGAIDYSAIQKQLPKLSDDDPDLKSGIKLLSDLLNMPPYGDQEQHLLMLQAIRMLIEDRLNPKAKAGSKHDQKDSDTERVSLAKTSLGFSVKDAAVEKAAKILRLLHLAEIRELQTGINEAIVAVQRLTANPKTDQSLGKVGR